MLPIDLESWLARIATADCAEDCMNCLDALNSMPPTVTALIWKRAETLLPRFWSLVETEAIEPERDSGKGFSNKVSQERQEHPCSDEGVSPCQTPGVEKPAAKGVTARVKELITGLWVRTSDGLYGHLGAMVTDGRWWVLFPKSRTADAQSRLYAAVDIIPMPNR